MVNPDCRTALVGSVWDKDTFSMLLNRGSDVHLNHSGSKCLVLLCYDITRIDHVKLLINKGVDINYIYNHEEGSGFSALINSIEGNNQPAFDELLTAGVDFNKENANGHAPLYYTIDRKRREMTQKLIDRSCIISQVDFNRAKEIDNEDATHKDSIYLYLTRAPRHPAKSLLINQLDDAIPKKTIHFTLPTPILDLISSYDDRYNHEYFLGCKDNIVNKTEKLKSTEPVINNEKKKCMSKPQSSFLSYATLFKVGKIATLASTAALAAYSLTRSK